MARVIEIRPNGAAVIEIPPEEAVGLEVGQFVEVSSKRTDESLSPIFGLWADKYDEPFTIEEIKAARQEALRSKD